MKDSNSNELYAQLEKMIDGVNLDGVNVDYAWIRRVYESGYLRGRDLLALLLITLRDLDDPTRDPKIIIEDWGPVVMRQVKEGKIVARDPHSRLAMAPENIKGWDWALNLGDADNFFDREIGENCSDIAERLFKLYEAEQLEANPDEDEERRLANPEKYKKEEQSYKRKYQNALIEMLSMAMARYEHDPKADINYSISMIVRDIENVTGEKVSDDAIRNRLREASEIHGIYENKIKS